MNDKGIGMSGELPGSSQQCDKGERIEIDKRRSGELVATK
jgi:hypothetical protein